MSIVLKKYGANRSHTFYNGSYQIQIQVRSMCKNNCRYAHLPSIYSSVRSWEKPEFNFEALAIGQMKGKPCVGRAGCRRINTLLNVGIKNGAKE
jgi:hypothetical protein